jgi:hypothetical protein
MEDGTIRVDSESMPDLRGLDRKLARWVKSVRFIAPRIILNPKRPSNDLKKLREIILVVRKHTDVYDVLID